MTADEQGPDTAFPAVPDIDEARKYWGTLATKNPLNASSLVYGLCNDLEDARAATTAARTERDTALAEVARLKDVCEWWGGNYDSWVAATREAEAAVVTARRDALTAVIDRIHRSSGVGWSNITRDDLLVWLDAVRAKETP